MYVYTGTKIQKDQTAGQRAVYIFMEDQDGGFGGNGGFDLKA